MRTKYDRMFERKNQGILSEHYTKLVDHEDDKTDLDDDFITLKRADHDLPDEISRSTQLPRGPKQIDHEDISKRKLKIGQSKRAMLKYKYGGTKLIFDDEGEAHQLYEMKDDAVFKQETGGDILGVGKTYVDEVRSRMRDEDLLDKAEAKDKKKERKRKRKAAEQEARVRVALVSILAHVADMWFKVGERAGPGAIAPDRQDDGYISPDFDGLLSEMDNDDKTHPRRPHKKRAKGYIQEPQSYITQDIEEDETLALKMLRGKT